MAARDGAKGRRARRVLDGPRHVRWLAGTTFRLCMKHRVTGLAAEIGFFALLSLPPLILGLAGTLGYFADVIGPETVERFRSEIIDVSRHALSDETVADTIVPTLNDVLDGGRFDIISVGFVLALWSGSRALNVTIDTIAIMYGLGGHRGIIATRALSFSLYIVGLVVAIVLLPLVLGGPELLELTLPDNVDWIVWFYWPVVTVLTAGALTTLFWIAVPVPNSWWRGMPGAVLAIAGWLIGSYFVRLIIDWAVGGSSIYGPLSAPIIVMIWLYALAIIMLIGAAFNAAVDRRWPQRHDDVTLDGIPVVDLHKHPTNPRRSPAKEPVKEPANDTLPLTPPAARDLGPSSEGRPFVGR
jgi:membrane protein